MKNTNRYKLIPVLVIGLVLSTFSAMAEVKTIITKGTITIKGSSDIFVGGTGEEI